LPFLMPFLVAFSTSGSSLMCTSFLLLFFSSVSFFPVCWKFTGVMAHTHTHAHKVLDCLLQCSSSFPVNVFNLWIFRIFKFNFCFIFSSDFSKFSLAVAVAPFALSLSLSLSLARPLSLSREVFFSF